MHIVADSALLQIESDHEAQEAEIGWRYRKGGKICCFMLYCYPKIRGENRVVYNKKLEKLHMM